MVRDQIRKALQDAVGDKDIHLEFPEQEAHGDYATNIAMAIFSKTPKSQKSKTPRELAESVAKKLRKDNKLVKIVSKIEVAGPGFINFFLSKDALLAELKKVAKEKDKYGSSNIGKGKKVLVEYSSPNIAKYFGVGHMRSTIIGQALYNLYKFLGYKTTGVNHLGDWGTQFGMIIAQVVKKNLDVNKLTVGDYEKLYVEFNKEVEERPDLREEARKWFRKLEEGDKRAKEIWKKARDTSLKEFERIYKLLGVEIDNVYGESFYAGGAGTAEDKMKAVVDEVCREGLMKKSRGAEIVELEGLPPAMLTKSDHATTYYTRDLATVKFRMEKFKPDIIIYEVGSEQKLHFKQVFATAELMGWLNSTELVHVAHGLIRFEGGKMSTRRGQAIKLEEVLDEAIERARKIIEESETPLRRGYAGQASRGLSKKEKDAVATTVGIGAIKYFDLSHHYSSDIIFDWEKMFVLEGNSAPYLQYTYARTQSVLGKARSTKHEARKSFEFRISDFEFNAEELTVLRSLVRFSEVIKQSARNYSPNLLCNYLFELSQKYNTFYNQHRILLPERKNGKWNLETGKFRLALTAGVSQVLKNGLTLLGINTPGRM